MMRIETVEIDSIIRAVYREPYSILLNYVICPLGW